MKFRAFLSRLGARVRLFRERRRLRQALTREALRVLNLERRLSALRGNLDGQERAFKAYVERASSDIESALGELASVNAKLDSSKREIALYEREVERLKSKLEVAENVSIPALVAANRLALERYNADTAVQLKRQMKGD